MLNRYEILLEHNIPKLSNTDIDDLLLSRKEEQDVNFILGIMKKLNSITLKL